MAELRKDTFKNVEEMNEVIIKNIITTLNKGDLLYVLGDICWNSQMTEIALKRLCNHGIQLYLIEGNHDKRISTKIKEKYFSKIYKGLHVINDGPIRITLTHFPLLSWSRSYADSWQLYGHIHIMSAEKPFIENVLCGKALNVNVEFNNYKPWSLKEIAVYMSKRRSNRDAEMFKKNKEV